MRLVLLGSALVIGGVVFPFLMVLRKIEPSFWLSFVSYGMSLTGLVLGIIFAVNKNARNAAH